MTPEELRARRRDLNLTQIELAEILEVSQGHLSDWETGRRPLNRLTKALLNQELGKLEAQRAKLAS